jgi:hypothetical protein
MKYAEPGGRKRGSLVKSDIELKLDVERSFGMEAHRRPRFSAAGVILDLDLTADF